MKILKVKIKREQTAEGTHYTYPFEYNPYKIQVLCYESQLPEKYQIVVNRGNKEEFLIGAVKDEDAPRFLESPDIQEITYGEALVLGNIWTKQTEKITDEKKVIGILAKVARNKTLTQQEKNALDPNHPEPGINLSRSFKEGLDELKAKL